MTVYAGQRLTAAALNATYSQVVARGRRTTDSTTTTTEGGVYRLDGVAVKSGGLYRIWTTPLGLDSSVANDEVFAQIRFTVDGTSATTSSTVLPGARVNTRQTDMNVEEHKNISTVYAPTADVSMSLLLTVGRIAGTGNCRIMASNAATDLVVEFVGADPTTTGVAI